MVSPGVILVYKSMVNCGKLYPTDNNSIYRKILDCMFREEVLLLLP
jgi:hypothetical protein